jgi:hypothetical protein
VKVADAIAVIPGPSDPGDPGREVARPVGDRWSSGVAGGGRARLVHREGGHP